MEDVIVEPDGQWHTADDKFGSVEWKRAHPPAKVESMSIPSSPIRRRSPTPVKTKVNENGHKASSEIVVLDSDDEEEGQVKRELSPSVPRTVRSSLASVGSQPPRSLTGESDVIDLTLDSDDEDPPVHDPPPKKRKADEQEITSPTEQVWKKSRADTHAIPPKTNGISSTASLPNGSSYTSVRDPRVLPPPSPGRYFPRSSASYSLPSASYIPPGGAPIPSRPPIPRADSYPTPPPRSGGTPSVPWSSQRY